MIVFKYLHTPDYTGSIQDFSDEDMPAASFCINDRINTEDLTAEVQGMVGMPPGVSVNVAADAAPNRTATLDITCRLTGETVDDARLVAQNVANIVPSGYNLQMECLGRIVLFRVELSHWNTISTDFTDGFRAEGDITPENRDLGF